MTNLKNTCVLAVAFFIAMSVIVSADDNEYQIMSTGTLNCTDMTNQTIVKVLYADRDIDVGTVEVSNDCQNIYVTYNTSGNWTLCEIHLEVARSFENIPMTNSGNPVVGHFGYKNDSLSSGATNYTYEIPINCMNGTVYIAAHAEVSDHTSSGNAGAWAAGTGFPGNNWATYFTFDIVQCDNNDDNVEDGGEDNAGDEGEDNAGDEGEDNAGDEGEDNAEDEGEDNAGDEGEDNAGDEGEDNAGDEEEDNAGDEGEDNAGDEGEDNAGDEGEDNAGDEGEGSAGNDAGTSTKKSGSSSSSLRMTDTSPVTNDEDDNAYMSIDMQAGEQSPVNSMQEPVSETEEQENPATIFEKGSNFLWVIIAMLLSFIWVMSGYGLTFH